MLLVVTHGSFLGAGVFDRLNTDSVYIIIVTIELLL